MPLAFAAAQPRCRIAAEAYKTAAGRQRYRSTSSLLPQDIRNGGQTTWDAWAEQLPFGEWWVSHLSQSVMPADEPPYCETRPSVVVDGCDIVVAQDMRERLESAARQAHRSAQAPSLSVRPLPSPPSSTLLHAPASAHKYMSDNEMNYRCYWEQRSATIAQFQTGVLDVAPAASADVAWPDCPYPGERLWRLSVKSRYAGGVHVGHLVSFLVPKSACRSSLEAAGVADEGCSGVNQRTGGPAETPYRRILHWDFRAELLQRQGKMCYTPPQTPAGGPGEGAEADERTNERDGAAAQTSDLLHGLCKAGATSAFSPCADPLRKDHKKARLCPEVEDRHSVSAASPTALDGSSWSYSHWWFCRPLCVSRCTSYASRSEEPKDAATASAHACTTPGVADASLYVYGSHPASLPCHLSVGCKGCAPHTSPSAVDLSARAGSAPATTADDATPCDVSSLPSPYVSSSHRTTPSFLTALHFHDCITASFMPVPVLLAPSSVFSPASPLALSSAERLRLWCEGLQRSGCCGRLACLEINFEGCVEDVDEAVPLVYETAVHHGLTGESAPAPAAAAVTWLSKVLHPLGQLNLLTDVRLLDSGLSDVTFLGTLPHLHLADLSMNSRLTDGGVEGLA